MGYRVTATDQLIEEYIRNPINKKDCFWTSHNLIRESKNIIPTHIFKIKADFVTDILIPSLVNNGQKFIYFLKTEKDANSIVNMCCEKTNDKKGSIFINGNIEQSNILYFDAKTRKKTEDLRKSILKKLKDEYLQKSEFIKMLNPNIKNQLPNEFPEAEYL